jgi:hypothetical protein
VIVAADTHQRLCHQHPRAIVELVVRDARRDLRHRPRHRALVDRSVTARIAADPDAIRLAGLLAHYREPVLRSAAKNFDGEYRKVTDAFCGKSANIFGLRDGEPELHTINGWLYDQEIIAKRLGATKPK